MAKGLASIALLAALLSAPLVAVGSGCSSKADADDVTQGNAASGEVLYGKLCASCHGSMAEGALGPALNPWTGTELSLVEAIDGKMPVGDPSSCDRACAEDIAAYLVGLKIDCGEDALPRRLRLLNRREYDSTVRDLLFPAGAPTQGASCQGDADCAIDHESCAGGVCVADPCNLRTFVLPGGGQSHASVAVAGSFNGWSPTASDWQMTYVASKDLWVLKRALQDGDHAYKLVIDGGTWVTDPANPETQDDGFGGMNSVLHLSCSGGAAPGSTGASGSPSAPADFHPSKSFPAEIRPDGYAFDNSAEAGLVTSVHVEQYMTAAASIAELALADLGNVLPCDPSPDAKACAKDFARTFGKRAFRRPLEEDEIEKYASVVLAQPDFQAGVGVAIQIMLSSPFFLYRSEIGAKKPDGTVALTPYEIASSLSYGLWGTMPDQALFEAAEKGHLATPAGVEAEARRLLADPRSRPVVEAFALQWLGVESILVAPKSAALYPGFGDAEREALAEETRQFVSHVIFDGNRRYEELLTADYTVRGGVVESVPPERRAGILAHGSVLGAYAYADQSSPVRRGLFVRRNLLCQDFPKPPPNAGKVPDVDPNATTRERFLQHTQDPSCATCHQYIDGVGFGFERFDAIGQYRESEGGKPIDASGDMNDVEKLASGTHAPFDGLPALATILAKSQSSKDCFARQVYRFGKGALESPDDRCAVDRVAARFAESGFDIQELMIAAAVAPAFAVRKGP
jgi:hypothetical protein